MKKLCFVSVAIACVYCVHLFGNDTASATKLAREYLRNQDYDMACLHAAKADRQDPDILFITGTMYMRGWGKYRQNREQGLSLLQEAAGKGNLRAYRNLAFFYFSIGRHDLARQYLLTSANGGEPGACLVLGIAYYSGSSYVAADRKKAEFRLAKVCKSNRVPPVAYIYYGLCIYPKDPLKALDCWKKADKTNTRCDFFSIEETLGYAEMADKANDADGYRILGETYQYGHDGVKKDYGKAAACYERAVKLAQPNSGRGNSAVVCSLERLAEIYFENPATLEKAVSCLHKLLQQKNLSKKQKGEALLKLGNAQLKCKKYKEAYKSFEEASSYGSSDADVELGLMHCRAAGIDRNYGEGKKFFEKASAKGNAKGYLQMGILYRNGNGVPYNESEAEKNFLKAVKLGKTGQADLAELYIWQNEADKAAKILLDAKKAGIDDVFIDVQLAKILQQPDKRTRKIDRHLLLGIEEKLEKAQSNGSADAACCLSEFLESGIRGVMEMNLAKSAKKLTEAAEQGSSKAHVKTAYRHARKPKPSSEDLKLAYSHLKQALDLEPNNTSALDLMAEGIDCGFWGNKSESAKYWKRSAERNSPGAAYHAMGIYIEKYASTPRCTQYFDKIEYYFKIAQRDRMSKDLAAAVLLHAKMLRAHHEGNTDREKIIFHEMEKYAKAGIVPSYCFLSLYYIKGWGVKIAPRKSEYYAKKIKDFQGDPRNNIQIQSKNNNRLYAFLQIQLGQYTSDPKFFLEAVKIYRKEAEQGDADAQSNLAYCFYNGWGVPKNCNEAVKWFQKAAEQGDANAQCGLAVCYCRGNGVKQDYAEAVKWLRKAVEQENADAQCCLAECYYNGHGVPKNHTEAVKWLRKAVEQENAVAQRSLAVCYYHGHGVPKDHAEAFKWFYKAAEQGDAYAQYSLGECYYRNEGVARSYAEAVKWFRKAAEQGYADAQCRLGECYYRNEGVTRSYAEAVKWFRKAAEQGHANAQYWFAVCLYFGKGIRQNRSEAVKWLRKAAEQGHTDAQNSLKEDPGEWNHTAIEENGAEAQYNLGVNYYWGRGGVNQNYAEAVRCYRKAAEQGHAGAQCNLGECYFSGKGVRPNHIEAVKWYRKAAEQGNSAAQYNLGTCYYTGTGIMQDCAQAIYWLRKAAGQGNAAAQMYLMRIMNSY